MLTVIAENYSVKNHDIRLFEPATVYIPSDEEGALPAEPVSLVLGMCSSAYKGENGFYRMKGYVDAILSYAGVVGEYTAEESDAAYHPGRCAAVTVKGERIAVLGEIHPEVLENYGIGMDAFAAEIDFEKLFELIDSNRRYAPLPKFPALERDLSLVCNEEITAGSIEKCIASAGGSSVSSVKLFDIYRGPQIGEGKKSVSFAVTLRASDRTLTDDEADGIIAKVMKKLSSSLGAELRS
jgi:phenylalanyl-tRNA synthetase beta chain